MLSQRIRLRNLAIIMASCGIYGLPLLLYGFKLLGLSTFLIFSFVTWLLGSYSAVFLLMSSGRDVPMARTAGSAFFSIIGLWLAYAYVVTIYHTLVPGRMSLPTPFSALAVQTFSIAMCLWLITQAVAILGVPDDGTSQSYVAMHFTARLIGGAILLMSLASFMATAQPGMGPSLSSFMQSRFMAVLFVAAGLAMVFAPAAQASLASLILGAIMVIGTLNTLHMMSALLGMGGGMLSGNGLLFLVGFFIYGTILFIGFNGSFLMWWLSRELSAESAGPPEYPMSPAPYEDTETAI